MRDGLSQIFPGGLDASIEDELNRIASSSTDQSVDVIELEMSAVSFFIQSVDAGSFVLDDTTLLDAVEPVAEAMAICGEEVEAEATHAMLDRGDYLNDYNFLRFLLDY